MVTFKDIAVQPLADGNFKLLKAVVINSKYTAPKDYETNGISIPRLFWSYIPPFYPKFLPAVIVHDYLCYIEDYVEADKQFKEILLSIEDSFKTKTMLFFVHLYHKIRYGI